MPRSYLSQLNPQQRNAATYGMKSGKAQSKRPLLIVAGAGCGKTKTLSCRVAHLVINGADPERILILTFGNRAAMELKSRVSDALKAVVGGRAPTLPWAGTFHSIGARIVRQHASYFGLALNFSIFSRSDAESLMSIALRAGRPKRPPRSFPNSAECSTIYSRTVNTRCSLASVLKRNFSRWRSIEKQLAKIFAAYEAEKLKQNAADYDDLLKLWLALLRNERNGRKIRSLYDYVLVDEFQDTNKLQLEILKSLKPDGCGVTVVGDDAQAIYSFRGARIENILSFPAQFKPAAKVIKLERNYRSTQPILDASNAVLLPSGGSLKKRLWSDKSSRSKPRLITVADEVEQAAYVADQIDRSRSRGLALNEQAILFRNSHDSLYLEQELTKRRIAFCKFGGQNLLETKVVKDIVGILRWVENPKDRAAGLRVLNLLSEIKPSFKANILRSLEAEMGLEHLEKVEAAGAAQAAWRSLRNLICSLNHSSNWSAEIPQIQRWYKSNVPNGGHSISATPVSQLGMRARGYDSRHSFLSGLAVDHGSDPVRTGSESDDYVVLSTIHSAKGREWHTVRIINAVDGCIPSRHAVTNAEREEERRLLYVAMTRAKMVLDIIVPRQIYVSHASGDGYLQAFLIRTPFITGAVANKFTQVSYMPRNQHMR